MKPLVEFVTRGGPVMIAIIALSVVLYSRCFKLLWSLRRSRRQLTRATRSATDRPALGRVGAQAQESFQQQRVALGAMIAAAPLLGLLGTVSGMVKTFESLSARGGEKSMEGLARGISGCWSRPSRAWRSRCPRCCSSISRIAGFAKI